MIIRANFFLSSSLLLQLSYFLVFFLGICNAKSKNQYCNPSSCGTVLNISYPFRLTSDPRRCGDHRYELSCENNQTILYLYNGRYFVESISYKNRTIRIKDPGIQTHNCSSLPLYSLMRYNFSYKDPYFLDVFGSYSSAVGGLLPIAFVDCPFQVTDSPFYKDASSCTRITNGSVYVVDGSIGLSDLKDSCSIRLQLEIEIESDYSVACLPDFHVDCAYAFRNLSLDKIHRSMAKGLELTWFNAFCGSCLERGGTCTPHQDGKITCEAYYCLGRITIHCIWSNYKRGIIYYTKKVLKILGFILVGRTSCGILLLLLLLLLVYKFRQRHLSFDEDIEEFLQNHSNRMPIRYSYSDIKSITRGFKTKLGQGGFGTVFKGTLRSGCVVAIKMLSNSKANGQEFMNEVATIGRIHHVNVVRLIGFCAE